MKEDLKYRQVSWQRRTEETQVDSDQRWLLKGGEAFCLRNLMALGLIFFPSVLQKLLWSLCELRTPVDVFHLLTSSPSSQPCDWRSCRGNMRASEAESGVLFAGPEMRGYLLQMWHNLEPASFTHSWVFRTQEVMETRRSAPRLQDFVTILCPIWCAVCDGEDWEPLLLLCGLLAHVSTWV